MKNIIVAVDGPAGSGKSSVSKEVAIRCGLQYIDSGAIYRTVTLHYLRRYGVLPADLAVDLNWKDIEIKQKFQESGKCLTWLNGEDVSLAIRNEEITRNIGIISDNIEIRGKVTELLRDWGKSTSLIMDGRDIGTVVFPNADLKLYIDASVEERARRRVAEYAEQGKNVDFASIKEQIVIRDNQDKARPVGRLIQADDAVYLDTSSMNKKEVIEKMFQLITAINPVK